MARQLMSGGCSSQLGLVGSACKAGCVWLCNCPHDHYTDLDEDCISIAARDHWNTGWRRKTVLIDPMDEHCCLYFAPRPWVRLV
jgi:hypothetical protein